ncbi:MAG: PoNi-like cognate immunity protein [Peptococcaceae bacterium]|nr:PoNi-like cognate immunity protein [Peptococcaceae bacterium]
MRDSLKDKKYFEKRYAKDSAWFEESFQECNDALAELAQKGDGFTGNIRMYHLAVVTDFQFKFHSGYSLGISKEELGRDLPKVLDAFLHSWNGTVYNDMEFMLALAIIYGIHKGYMRSVLLLLIEHNYQDYVLDSMAHYIDPNFTVRTGELLFKEHSQRIAEIINLAETNKEEAALYLAYFLEKEWLGMQTEGIINNQQHLKEDKYRGYWSLESAALVKMLHLNDDRLKRCRHYPYDL